MCQIVQVPLYITSDSVEFNDFSSLFFFTVSLVKPLNRQQLVLILEPYMTVLIFIVSVFNTKSCICCVVVEPHRCCNG